MDTNDQYKAVIGFFLELFKYQISGKKQVEAESQFLGMGAGNDAIYELKVIKEDAPVSRRITIAALGEGSGSSSKCYKVIYDNLMVVKIPGNPVPDFGSYVDMIRSDRRIASRLSPEIHVVSPTVSAMMKKVKQFSNSSHLSFSKLEDKYIKWLNVNRSFQKFLKINDEFAFFMDLSEYYFLSQAVHEIHDKKPVRDQVKEEIKQAAHVSGDPLMFDNQYDSLDTSILFEMHRIYTGYGQKVRSLLSKYGLASKIPAYRVEQWFLIRLAGMETSAEEKGFPPDLITDLHRILDHIVKNHKDAVNSYKTAIKNHVRHRLFLQNKWKMGGTIANILELLAKLKNKELAIRDLKPDNMFIVGDLNNYPLFLAYQNEFSIGLIDLETAVAIGSRKSGKIAQPRLGGTPSFATPSHFFPNKILEKEFDRLDQIFYFQDWFAAIGMVYNLITGDVLFERTRIMLRKIIEIRKKKGGKSEDISKIFRDGSRTFWSSATDEFIQKITTMSHLLKSVNVNLSENAKEMLSVEIDRRKSTLANRIKHVIKSQIIFKSSENRKRLYQSPIKELQKQVHKWEKGIGIPKTDELVRKQVVHLLKILEQLKREAEAYENLHTRMCAETVSFSVFELMEIMFDCVLNAMYNPKWGKLSEHQYQGIVVDSDMTDPNQSTTIIYEDTIGYE